MHSEKWLAAWIEFAAERDSELSISELLWANIGRSEALREQAEQ